ncbi:MAG: hypothetical protein WD066_19115, partial [Planctomycetaceae bacterium]
MAHHNDEAATKGEFRRKDAKVRKENKHSEPPASAGGGDRTAKSRRKKDEERVREVIFLRGAIVSRPHFLREFPTT